MFNSELLVDQWLNPRRKKYGLIPDRTEDEQEHSGGPDFEHGAMVR